MISLDMQFEAVETAEGEIVWMVDAPWLDAPLEGPTFFEVYWAAVTARPRR